MRISIEGMHGPACVNRVRMALEKVEGIQVQAVQVGSADVVVTKAGEAAAMKAIEHAGYHPHVSV